MVRLIMLSSDLLSLTGAPVVTSIVKTEVMIVTYAGHRGVFRPRQTRQLPRAVDLKGRLLSCQSY